MTSDTLIRIGEVITASELVQDGRCSPACLIAASEERYVCRCRCGGMFHGSLATVEVPSSSREAAWWTLIRNVPAQEHLDRLCPVYASGPEFNAIWHANKRRDQPTLTVNKTPQGWRVNMDTWSRQEGDLSRPMAELGLRLATAVLHAGRVEWVGPGRSGWTAHGLRSREEAQTLGWAVAGLVADDPGPAEACIATLGPARSGP